MLDSCHFCRTLTKIRARDSHTGTIIALVALWFCISAPLVFLGSILGYKKAAVELPVRTNQIPRHIPEQPWYMQAPFTVMMGGILPFGAVFIELFFILTSIWLNRSCLPACLPAWRW